MDWQKLRSGSDVRGTATGEGTELTANIAESLGMAFVSMLSKESGKSASDLTVALGRDSRITGPVLLRATAEGIIRAGASVLDFSLCTTPAMYMSTITAGFEADGAVMITASHHPWNKNGLKFFTPHGGLDSIQVAELLSVAQTLQPELSPVKGNIYSKPFLPVYMDLLATRVRSGLDSDTEKPLEGLHVVVDAGNGAGGFYAQLMSSLGADTTGSQFLEPDGTFPNHIPNPENPEAMKSLSRAVIQSGADIGVIFDADCDRGAVVDSDGKEINRNRLIALISAILLEEKQNQTIVTDSVTSTGLTSFIQMHGGKHYRYKRGYRNVIDEAIRLNKAGEQCPVAIETSGHAALQENHFLDDGMYLATVLIIRAMKMKRKGLKLGDLICDLKEASESIELRFSITDPDFRNKGNAVIQKVLEYAEKKDHWHIAPDNREGIRILFDLNGIPSSGWFLLRLSVHDPVLPLNAESDISGGISTMLRELYTVLKDVDGIDLSELRNVCHQS